MIEIDGHLDALTDANVRLAAAAGRAGLDAPVASCPEWDVRQLVAHTGGVQRWATAVVRDRRVEPMASEEQASHFTAPRDAELLAWFADGAGQLVEVLSTAPRDLECFTFLEAPSPLAFWCRRQAHEAAVHCADAEMAALTPPVFDARFAADGVDELVDGFFSRPRRAPLVDEPFTIELRARDLGRSWPLVVGTHQISRAPDGRLDCVVEATASDLYLWAWNRRREGDSVVVSGDASLAHLWHESLIVRWRS